MYKYSGIDFSQISTDSRTLKPGALFVAIKGENFDGHEFISEAISKGAKALVVSKEITAEIPVFLVEDTLQEYGQIAAAHRNSFNIPVIAITGSCGKTTVTALVSQILSQKAKILAPKGSFNNEIGLPKTLLELNSEHQYVVLEMGARKAGDIGYLAKIARPTVGMINNAAGVHLETFGDLDGVAKAKGEMYESLSTNSYAVVNVDDSYAPYWLSNIKSKNIVTFGLENPADITCDYIVEEHHQLRFSISTEKESVEICLPMLGLHNVMNVLAATAIVSCLQIPLIQVKSALESFQGVNRRMQRKAGRNGSTIIDDSYNANPKAMNSAIDVLAKQQGKKLLVIGDMLELGSLEQQYHKEIGLYAKQSGIQKLYSFGKLAMIASKEFGTNSCSYNNKQDLIKDLLQNLDENTTVLVKGSNGMKLDEVVQAIEEIKE